MNQRLNGEVGRIEIVLAGNPDQREQRVAPGVGERCAHAMGSYRLGGWANRPVGGDPLTRGVHQRGRQLDQAAVPVDRRALNRCDFMLAKAFANDVEAHRQGGIAKRSFTFARKRRLDGGSQRLFRIDDLGLRFGERRRQRANFIAGPLHSQAPL